jgi:hypothetical protein
MLLQEMYGRGATPKRAVEMLEKGSGCCVLRVWIVCRLTCRRPNNLPRSLDGDSVIEREHARLVRENCGRAQGRLALIRPQVSRCTSEHHIAIAAAWQRVIDLCK